MPGPSLHQWGCRQSLLAAAGLTAGLRLPYGSKQDQPGVVALTRVLPVARSRAHIRCHPGKALTQLEGVAPSLLLQPSLEASG